MKALPCFLMLALSLTGLVGLVGCNKNQPRAMAHRMEAILAKTEKAASNTLKEGGLPAPPKAIELMTKEIPGMDQDLRQALEIGDPASVRRLHQMSLAALRGLILHYSRCLDEPVPPGILGGGDILLPPGSAEEAGRMKATMDFAKHKVLLDARAAYLDAFHQIAAMSLAGASVSGVASATNLLSRQLEVAGLGHVWIYRFLRPAGRQYALSPDGTLWMRIEGQHVAGIREGRIVGEFDVPSEIQIELMDANEKGLVVFGPAKGAPSSGTALLQFDQAGKVLWRKDLGWNPLKTAGNALLASLDSGEVYIDLRFVVQDSRGTLGYASHLSRVDATGQITNLALPSAMGSLDGFYKMDDHLYVLDHFHGLSEITGDTFKPAMKTPEGKALTPGDDGCWYATDEHRAVRLGDKPVEYEATDTSLRAGCHITQDGRLLALVPGKLAARLPGSDRNALEVPVPASTRLLTLGKGRVLLDSDQNDMSSQFVVVELK